MGHLKNPLLYMFLLCQIKAKLIKEFVCFYKRVYTVSYLWNNCWANMQKIAVQTQI